MNTDELSFGQRRDPENNLVQSWITHGALDEIIKMDLTAKVIFQFGCGMGDAWLAQRCKKLYCVERNEYWLNKSMEIAAANGIENIQYIYRPCNDCSGEDKMYCELPEGIDVIINDDAYRYEVCVVAEEYFKKRNGGILITDNWLQDYVFVCPKADELLNRYEHKIFSQPDHTDFENEGGEWKTAIHFIK